MFFLRKPSLERLPVAMCGVRMGERVLQIGVDDPTLSGAIAAKVGLSGHAAIVVAEPAHEGRARTGAARAGALVDVHVTPLDTLPFDPDAFDVAVVHPAGIARFEGDAGVSILRDLRRVLRSGGRVLVIERDPRRGLLRRRAALPAAEGMLSMLAAAGLRAARLLAEREGYRFLEAIKA